MGSGCDRALLQQKTATDRGGGSAEGGPKKDPETDETGGEGRV